MEPRWRPRHWVRQTLSSGSVSVSEASGSPSRSNPGPHSKPPISGCQSSLAAEVAHPKWNECLLVSFRSFAPEPPEGISPRDAMSLKRTQGLEESFVQSTEQSWSGVYGTMIQTGTGEGEVGLFELLRWLVLV